MTPIRTRFLLTLAALAATASLAVAQTAPASSSNDTPIAPAAPAAAVGTQLQPGWVVRTYPLADHPLEKIGDVLSAFVVPESTFHLNDHIPYSLFSPETAVAYELSGYLEVKEAGEHSLGLLIDEGGSNRCAARASIENQVVFEEDRMGRGGLAYDPMIGVAKLEPGLYQVRIWIGCRYQTKPQRVRIIARTPSMLAPTVLPAARIGHKELPG